MRPKAGGLLRPYPRVVSDTFSLLIRRVAVPHLGQLRRNSVLRSGSPQDIVGAPRSPPYQSRPGHVRALPVTVNFQFLKDNIPRVQPKPRWPEPFQHVHVVLVVSLSEARQMAQHPLSLLDVGAHVHGNFHPAACEISKGIVKQQSCHACQRAFDGNRPGPHTLARGFRLSLAGWPWLCRHGTAHAMQREPGQEDWVECQNS